MCKLPFIHTESMMARAVTLSRCSNGVLDYSHTLT